MTSNWQLQPIFGSYLVVAVLTLLLAASLVAGPTFGNLSQGQQRSLATLRAVLVLLIAIALLRPAHITYERRIQTAQLCVLFDASRSMGYRDGEGSRSRWEEQQAILQRALPQLSQMGDHFSVELLAFSDEIAPQPDTGGSHQITATPTGEETDLGKAISQALQRYGGKRLAGVILLSDGAQRAVAPDIPPQQAARQLDRRAVPLYTITLGRSRDQSQARDVAIENLQDHYSVFVKNEFALRVGVRVQGYVGQPIPITVDVEDATGATLATLGPQVIRATQDSQTVMADFVYRAELAGQFRLRVRAGEQSGELTDNNQMTAFLEVREGGVRVLLLTSSLLQEPKFIKRSLDEAPDVELDLRLIDVRSRNSWPIDIEQDLSLKEYDVVLVGDLDASAVSAATWQHIAQRVEAGVGLMMFGGFHSFGPGGFAETPLAAVLPIEMDRFERQSLEADAPLRAERHLAGPVTMVPTSDSSVTHLAPGTQNGATWKELKSALGANRFDRLKDRSQVLLESPNRDPLLVQGGYVSGRVLAFAVDTTYRWWRYGQQEAHKKFWRQAVLWLARRDQPPAGSIWIKLPQRRFRLGSRVTFETARTDEAGDVVVDVPLRASVTTPSGQRQEVPLTDPPQSGGAAPLERPGMQGLLHVTEPGIYRLEVGAADALNAASRFAEFVVLKEDFELSDPAANPGLMDLMARITSRVGGKAIAPEQLPGLLEAIKAAPPRDEIETQSKWQLGETPWDAWTFFLLLFGLLASEWYLRKRWGMV